MVESTFGLGSRFELSISCGALDDSQWAQSLSDAQLVQVSGENSVVVPKLEGRILYAEDNKDNQQLIRLLLKPTGCELIIVENGQEAVDLLRVEEFDLVLMDIQMPRLNGIDATKIIRQDGYSKPILALTANVMKGDLSSYAAAGCDDCLSKPVDKLKFYQALNSYLGVDDNRSINDEITQVTGRLLLAEDNLDSQRLISMQIKRTGADVVLVSNGEEAVEMAMAESFDLILMDVQMPLMNGDEAVQLLRETGCATPIYVLTANNNKTDIDRFLSCGFDGYLSKPIDTKQLFSTIALHLNSNKVESIPLGALGGVAVSVAGSPGNALLDDPNMRPLVINFQEGLVPMLAALNAAKIVGDWGEIQGLAHQLKGSAGSFGYPQLTNYAGELEGIIRDGDEKKGLLAYESVIDGMHCILKNSDVINIS